MELWVVASDHSQRGNVFVLSSVVMFELTLTILIYVVSKLLTSVDVKEPTPESQTRVCSHRFSICPLQCFKSFWGNYFYNILKASAGNKVKHKLWYKQVFY